MRKSIIALLLATGIFLSAGTAKADLAIVKSKFDVTLYGYIKAEMIYHSARATSSNLILFAYPDVEPFNRQHTLAFEARQTRFGLNIAGPGISENSKVLGNIEMDFYGTGFTENKAAMMMRRATVTLKFPKMSFMAGQDWMLISPLFPHTSNYPAGSGMGNLGHRMPQFRATIGDPFRFAISIGRKIEGDLTTSDFDAGSVSSVPDTQVQIGYWGKNGLVVAASGHYAEELYTITSGTPVTYFYQTMESWSTNLSVNIPIGKRLALSGEAYYGANLDGWYTGNIFGEGVGRQANDTIVPVHDMGGWVELMVKPINKLTMYIGFGEDDPLNEDISKGPYPALPASLGLPSTFNGFTLNQMYYGHFIYDITDAFKVSLEVMQVRTEYHNEEPHSDGVVWSTDLAFWYYF